MARAQAALDAVEHGLRNQAAEQAASGRVKTEGIAENLAEQYQVTRADQDAFAVASQNKASAARAEGLTYNRFIQGLKAAEVEVDRRMLAELAVNEPAAFKALVGIAKENLPEDTSAPKAA